MQEIIKELECDIERCISDGNPFDSASWGYEEGVLISPNTAQKIVFALKEISALKAEIEKERWIPVSERLPEKNDAFGEWENVWWYFGHYSFRAERWDSKFARKHGATHWKPINPPQ